MRRKVVAGVLALAAMGGVARAQQPPDAGIGPGYRPNPPPMMHLSAVGTVQASQDLLVADLVAQATAATPAAAQSKVNTMMAAGVGRAKTVNGVDARAIGYSVSPVADDAGQRSGVRRPQQWTAQQTLELRGTDGPPLLDLAGKLQEGGFAAATLDWQLSPASRHRAYEAATIDALKQIQARAAAAADALGIHVGRYADVRLDDASVQPVERSRPMMQTMVARAEAPAPEATAAPEDVTADVSVDVELRQ